MSLSKDLCLRNDSQKFESKKDDYRRDSFSDCFCDDLSEVLFKFLSLEDKFRLECVSKQFQRTVFQRQYELCINLSPVIHKRCLNLIIRRDLNYYYITKQSMDSFKALLKKCPKITSIELDAYHSIDRQYDNVFINEVFQLIIENCNNLSEIYVRNINDSNFKEFHRKFGPKIKSLGAFRSNWNVIDLNLFPNIEKLIISNVKDYSIVPQLSLTKLKKLDIFLLNDQEYMLQTFIDTFPTLTDFRVHFRSGDENAIYKSLKNISNLKHLIHFSFDKTFGGNINPFCNLLKQMSNNCQNLKSIDCRIVDNNKNSDIRQLLSQLKEFPALKRFYLWLIALNPEERNYIDVNQLFSFELFKGFENITHLSLRFNGRQTLKESILKEIDINLPKLQYLEIGNRFDTTPEEVTQMADILSRLSRLETLNLKFKKEIPRYKYILTQMANILRRLSSRETLKFESEIDLKPIEKQVMQKCRKIREIELKTLN